MPATPKIRSSVTRGRRTAQRRDRAAQRRAQTRPPVGGPRGVSRSKREAGYGK